MAEKEKSRKTPRGKAKDTLRKAGISPRRVTRLIRKHWCLPDEVKQAVQNGAEKSNTRRGLTASVVAGGGVLKKYCCIRFLNKSTGISRDLLSKIKSKLSYPAKRRLQDASDFFAWTQQYQSASSVAFTFVSKEACSTAQSEIERFGEIKPAQGTMSEHAVAAISPGKIIARETSCHCQQCFTNGSYNPESPCSWKTHILKECPEEAEVVPATVYDGKWYAGKVLAIDLCQ